MGTFNIRHPSPNNLSQQTNVKYLLIAVMMATAASAGHHQQHRQQHHQQQNPRLRRAGPTKNIAELAIATPTLSTLLAAVKAAGLVDTLAGPGPFTVFAPSNNAFAQIPSATLNGLLADKPALTAVLLRHVVPGAIFAKNVPPGETVLDTAGGEKITVTRDANNYISIRSSAGESYAIAFDVAATNGVVHVVNKVF